MDAKVNHLHTATPSCGTVHGCCMDHHTHTTKKSSMLRVLECVSAVALGVFSAITNIKLFVPFFLVGMAIGVYQYLKEGKQAGNNAPVSACSQGFLEQLTGSRLPVVISLMANIAVTLCHIDHHSDVFVPIVALTLGTWVGKVGAECGSLIYRKFHMISMKANVACCVV